MNNKKDVNKNPVIDVNRLATQNFEDMSSSSSSGSDLVVRKKNKRPSVDPLETLEHLHDNYVSSSDESFDGDANVEALEMD